MGHETSGQIGSVSHSTSLVVDGAPRQINEADAVRIWRRGDSLKNGPLWGLATGAGMGVLATATCAPHCHGEAGAGGVVVFLAAEGIGVGVLRLAP